MQRAHPNATTRELHGLAAPSVLRAAGCASDAAALHDTLSLPPMAAGQLLLFCHVGAYNLTHWSQALAPRPAFVMVGPAGDSAIIRRAERSADLNAFESLPTRLA